MMRSFVVALVTIAAVAVLVPSEELAAVSQPTPAGGSFSYPVDVVGGTPGVSIEVFLNGGKVQDTTVGSGGDASWVLDLSNVGKTRVTVYVDVCQDGKVVKVAFVTGAGQAPPEDENCNRRIGGVGWTSDCGVTRITINIRTWGANVIGCTPFYQRPPFIGIAGGLVALPFIFGGGDDGPSVISGPPVVQQPPTVNVPSTPPLNTTTPPAQPQPPTVTQVTPRFFIVLVNHPAGATTSRICGIVQIDPVVAGVTWSLAGSGPGVLPNQNIGGTFNSNGQAAFVLGISQFGQYLLTLTTNNQGQVQTATSNVSVNSSSFNCPTVPA